MNAKERPTSRFRPAPGFCLVLAALTAIRLAIAGPLWPQEPVVFADEGPGNCYALTVTERLRGSPVLGWPDQIHGWWLFLCPAGEEPALDQRGPAHEILDRVAGDTSDPAIASWARIVGEWSGRTLATAACQAATYARSIGKFQGGPNPDRNRSAREIKAWMLDLTGPGRPAEARMFEPIIAVTSQKKLKQIHDEAKEIWPVLAAVGCPEVEP